MVSIIGGGPVGAYTGYLLARAGFNVDLFEEHHTIGKPVQCTGIVTKHLSKIMKLDDVLVNKLEKVNVFAPSGKCAEIKVKEFVIDREEFDKNTVEMAVSEGVRVNLRHKFKGFNDKSVMFHNGKKAEKELLIGADGPLSGVGKSAGMVNKKFYFGMQARVNMKNESDAYEVYFGRDYPKFFGWVVPESDKICRVGVACGANTKQYFDRFIKKRVGKSKILSKQGGLIPVYDLKMKICDKGKNVYLVGDAAGMVKASTGGGLVPGFRGAEVLADCVSNGKDYGSESMKKVGRNLKIHLWLRNVLNRFSDKDYELLIRLVGKKKVRDFVNDGDREFPLKFLLKLAFKEPRFLYFMKNL